MPAVSARPKAIARPPTKSSPKERTMGIGERIRTRNPAAVASAAVATIGPPAAAASPAARAGDEPGTSSLRESRLKLNRIIDGQADQDRQSGDHRHRQRASEDGERTERDRARDKAHAQRQEPERGREDEREDQRHHKQRGDQKGPDLPFELTGQAVGQNRRAADQVRARCGSGIHPRPPLPGSDRWRSPALPRSGPGGTAQ